MGLFPAELRLSHQSQGHEIFHRLNRERQTADDRPLPRHLSRRGSSRGEAHPCCEDAREGDAAADLGCRRPHNFSSPTLKSVTSPGLRAIISVSSSNTSTPSRRRSLARFRPETSRTSRTSCATSRPKPPMRSSRSRCSSTGACGGACRRQSLRASLHPKSSPRERVLTEAEIKAVYSQAKAFPYPFGAIVRLLILTGPAPRRDRPSPMEVDRRNQSDHHVPCRGDEKQSLAYIPFWSMAAEIFASLPRIGDYVFPATREIRNGVPVRVVNGWSKLKTKFDKFARRGRALDTPRFAPHVCDQPRRARHADPRHREIAQSYFRNGLRRRRDLQSSRLHGRDACGHRRLGEASRRDCRL